MRNGNYVNIFNLNIKLKYERVVKFFEVKIYLFYKQYYLKT